MTTWQRVSRQHPCPVCGKHDWCGIAADTGAVCCMRVQSDRPTGNGGWLHGGSERPSPPPRAPAPGYEPPDFDATLWWRTVRHVARWDPMEAWATRLGLPIETLDVMGGCTLGTMLAFPMYDGTGQVCGIRTRNRDGSKRAVTGSRAGVFLPTMHDPAAKPVICEGPTDAAAAFALGFYPIGRPSCTGCERHVADTCHRLGIKEVTLCADADGPGIAGARKLGDVLQAAKISVCMVTPCGHKDLRDWFKAGATRDMVDAQWSQAKWRG
ncbi:MAG: toprim domain-containing protein [bacterium]